MIKPKNGSLSRVRPYSIAFFGVDHHDEKLDGWLNPWEYKDEPKPAEITPDGTMVVNRSNAKHKSQYPEYFTIDELEYKIVDDVVYHVFRAGKLELYLFITYLEYWELKDRVPKLESVPPTDGPEIDEVSQCLAELKAAHEKLQDELKDFAKEELNPISTFSKTVVNTRYKEHANTTREATILRMRYLDQARNKFDSDPEGSYYIMYHVKDTVLKATYLEERLITIGMHATCYTHQLFSSWSFWEAVIEGRIEVGVCTSDPNKFRFLTKGEAVLLSIDEAIQEPQEKPEWKFGSKITPDMSIDQKAYHLRADFRRLEMDVIESGNYDKQYIVVNFSYNSLIKNSLDGPSYNFPKGASYIRRSEMVLEDVHFWRCIANSDANYCFILSDLVSKKPILYTSKELDEFETKTGTRLHPFIHSRAGISI